jgi:hypothetical protein
MQNAAVADGNGETLNTNGLTTAGIVVNCVICSGGTTFNFEGTIDGTNYASLTATKFPGTSTATSATTSGVTNWTVAVAGLQNIRVRISAYSAGTVTVDGFTSPAATVPAAGAATVTGDVNVTNSGTFAIQCTSGCSGGTTDTDDGTIAASQTIGLVGGETLAFDGTNWKRLTTSAAGSGLTTGLLTVQGTATGSALPVTGTITAVTAITNALPAGTNVIGHVITDTNSTTAVTGNVTAVQTTGTNLHTVVDSGTVTANAGTNLNTSALSTSAKQSDGSAKTQIVDGSGNVIAATSNALNVAVVSGSTGNAAASATGSSVPAQASYTGGNNSGNLVGITATNPSGSIQALDVAIKDAPAITYNATQPTLTDGQTASDVQITSRAALIVNPGTETFNVTCASGCSGGTTDTDDGTVATAQTTGIQIGETYVFDGTNWKRATIGTAGTASAQVTTVQGVASMTPVQVSQATAASLNATVVGTGTFATQSATTAADGSNVVLGSKADAKSTATDTTSISMMQALKQISASVQAPPSQAVTNAGTFATQPTGVGAGSTGSSVPSTAVYMAAQNASAQLAGDIVCTLSKIYDASTNGNTELVAISSTTHIYVCGYEIWAAGTVNVSLITGTGTACASAASGTPSTGTSGAAASLTPAFQFTAQTGKLSAYPTHGFLIDTGSANALCLKTSAGVAVQAQVFYSQR